MSHQTDKARASVTWYSLGKEADKKTEEKKEDQRISDPPAPQLNTNELS